MLADQQTGWFQERIRQSAANLGTIDAEKGLSEAIVTNIKLIMVNP